MATRCFAVQRPVGSSQKKIHFYNGPGDGDLLLPPPPDAGPESVPPPPSSPTMVSTAWVHVCPSTMLLPAPHSPRAFKEDRLKTEIRSLRCPSPSGSRSWSAVYIPFKFLSLYQIHCLWVYLSCLRYLEGYFFPELEAPSTMIQILPHWQVREL